jgi:3-methyladenine DNA glycosylase AlkD
MTPQDALAALEAQGDPARAEQMATYHKAPRRYLGVTGPAVNELSKTWRQSLSVEDRVALADGLWKTDIFEARLAAAKLLTQARMRPDDAAWDLICSWVPDFDSWALADHVCSAGGRRLIADTSRLDTVEAWTTSEHMWTRRAALVITLPWTKQNHPTQEDQTIRDRVLGWAALYVSDHDWSIQKTIAWWLRDLSKHAPDQTHQFLEAHGLAMMPFARKEALSELKR